MSSPLFDMMGSNQMPGPMGQMQQMLSAFQEFRDSFKGDAREEVQKLLNSGQMSQEQYNQLQQMANQMAHMMGR